MKHPPETLKLLVAFSILSFFISAYVVLSTYVSAPSRLAVSCDVYGRPVVGYKTELLSWLVAPSLAVSAIATGVLNAIALAGTNVGSLRRKMLKHGAKVLYPLPISAALLSLFTGWIDTTTILAASSLVPVYPLLIAVWFLVAFLSVSFFLAVYILWIKGVIEV